MKRMTVRLKQGLGKVRRFTNGKLRRGHVRRLLRRRRGECVRCGACCKLLFECPMLETHEDGSTSCRIHQRRPENCRIFPVDERCLAERNALLPETPCGYHFEDETASPHGDDD
jgi:Fe-S-cluster containining protein